MFHETFGRVFHILVHPQLFAGCGSFCGRSRRGKRRQEEEAGEEKEEEENTEEHCSGELRNLGARPTEHRVGLCEGCLISSHLSQNSSTVHNLEAEWFSLCNSWRLMMSLSRMIRFSRTLKPPKMHIPQRSYNLNLHHYFLGLCSRYLVIHILAIISISF